MVARFETPDGRASVQLVSGDATSPQDSVISVHVGNDVDEAYAKRGAAATRSFIR